MNNTIILDLKERGLIHDSTNLDTLSEYLQSPRSLYVGFDPTADSLHVGSLLPLITLKRFALQGHTPILLIGGGTGLIGDPSGRSSERTLQSNETIRHWTETLQRQVAPLFQEVTACKIIDNATWLTKLSLLEFLRDIGKEFTVNYMLAKDSVAARIKREDTGISFTEFSYMILQAYDFLHLFQTQECAIQIGGSDQWGNITAGCELIRKKTTRQAYGLTLPLLTKADGSKFGKSAEGTIWLDSAKTSAYHFYQYWVNVADADLPHYLQYFSLQPQATIKEIIFASEKQPHLRIGQKSLAAELTKLLHGEQATKEALSITQAFFNQSYDSMSIQEFQQIAVGGNSHILTREQFQNYTITDLLTSTLIATSKREAREFIKAGAISINAQSQTTDIPINTIIPYHNKYLIIAKGKKAHILVSITT
ncbi:MAG: tyrosine--tRNA ligase [Methylacidiphilales bacterium]|nr:tyrosine--tRNA ligase [Candidatus Methylacidiphilales bacterium]